MLIMYASCPRLVRKSIFVPQHLLTFTPDPCNVTFPNAKPCRALIMKNAAKYCNLSVERCLNQAQPVRTLSSQLKNTWPLLSKAGIVCVPYTPHILCREEKGAGSHQVGPIPTIIIPPKYGGQSHACGA